MTRAAVAAAVVATAAVGAAPTEVDAQAGWQCTPIDPAQALPSDPCFRATVADGNVVTLEWRVANASSLVYVMDDLGPQFSDPGFTAADCIAGATVGCSMTQSVDAGGTYRWRLAVSNAGGARATVPASVAVTAPTPPTVTGGGHVDMLNPTAQTIGWSHASTAGVHDEWIEVVPSNFLAPPVRDDDLSGSGATYTVPQSALSAPGEHSYGVRYCTQATAGATKLCSGVANVAFGVGPARFLGDHRIQVASGSDLSVGLTQDSGTLRLLSSDTLVPPNGNGLRIAGTTAATYTIDDALLTPGHHTIELVSCQGWTVCSNRADAALTTVAGTVDHVPSVVAGTSGYYLAGETVATVTPTSGAAQTITAPATGHVYFPVADGASVSAGTLVAFVITANKDVLHIEVDGAVDWTLDRAWQDDFSAGVARDVLGDGGALDIDYDADGGIWELGEFTASIEHVTPAGAVESLNVPLLRKDPTPGDSNHTYETVKPFANPMSAPGVDVPTSTTTLGERVVEVDGKMWFTQGGQLLHDGVGRNHSRAVSFDPTVSDDPYTEWHDGLCAVHLPGDDNEAVGLTAASGRIWVGEYGTNRISSFDPDTVGCTNNLDYDDATAVAAATAVCESGETPEVDGCVATVALPSGVRIAHLDVDPVDGSLWFSDPSGNVLGHVTDLLGTPDVETFELPDSVEDIDGNVSFLLFQSYPWALRVTDDAVLLGEYGDNDVVRFDKATETMDEIHLPFENRQIRLHSIDVDAETDRLWFTLSNETRAPSDPGAGRIGYIDLAGWSAHVEDPVASPTIDAVTYAGFGAINTSGPNSAWHSVFRGIAVNQDDGRIALAAVHREQIVELTPKATFRP